MPGPSDAVVIPAGPSITITHSTGADSVSAIVCGQPFNLSGGSLSVSTTFQINNPLTLSGGTLLDASVSVTNGASLVVTSGTLYGVTVDGTLDVGNSVGGGVSLTVLDGLTLNGTMLVGNPSGGSWGVVSFTGSQVLGGNGTVVFGPVVNEEAVGIRQLPSTG